MGLGNLGDLGNLASTNSSSLCPMGLPASKDEVVPLTSRATMPPQEVVDQGEELQQRHLLIALMMSCRRCREASNSKHTEG